jgi:SAM-dependent methyltransferase
MSLKVTLDRKLYPELGDNWDDQLFRERLLEIVEPNMTCLDFGAGRGNVKQLDLRGHVERVAGVDPDPAVFENPFVQEAKVLDLATQRIDFPDATFDLAYADNVFEHIPDPEITFAELFRVLKPGGVLMAKTPNLWHYMPMIARLTPAWFHRYYNSLRGREEQDTFATLYRANSRRRVRKLAAGAGFEVASIDVVEGRPEYLRLTAPTYLVGAAYERLVNSARLFEGLRCVLYIKLLKPGRS